MVDGRKDSCVQVYAVAGKNPGHGGCRTEVPVTSWGCAWPMGGKIQVQICSVVGKIQVTVVFGLRSPFSC